MSSMIPSRGVLSQDSFESNRQDEESTLDDYCLDHYVICRLTVWSTKIIIYAVVHVYVFVL